MTASKCIEQRQEPHPSKTEECGTRKRYAFTLGGVKESNIRQYIRGLTEPAAKKSGTPS